MNQLDLLWEEDLTIRRHPRARHVRLKVVPPGRVEVVVPQQFDSRELPAILAHHQEWIDRTIDRMRFDYRTSDALRPPEQVVLDAIGGLWQLHYEPRQGSRGSLREPSDGELRLRHSGEEWRSLLKRWLVRKAEQQLVPWLERTSDEVGLPFAGATIRCQKSRWGSCSAQRGINLNVNLLFLPPQMVRYLFIHELCHTRHLNHSSRYWSLVESKEPAYRELDAALRKANHLIPLWALP
jgi:predicted metal-dependent hydrolase